VHLAQPWLNLSGWANMRHLRMLTGAIIPNDWNVMKSLFPVNENNVVQYPKNDPRRLFVLLCAIELLERPTLTTLASFTGINKGVIDGHVNNLNEFYGVMIDKEGPVYVLRSWGDLLNKEGVLKCLYGARQPNESLSD